MPSGLRRLPLLISAGLVVLLGLRLLHRAMRPARGIGGVLLMQYLPFYDGDAIATLQGFERRVYQGLAD